MKEKHFVYILLTKNDTLYCGYTDNVEKRFKAHLEGRGAKYTKANKPVKILWQKEFPTKNEALKEEYRIKHKLTRAQKFALIEQGI
jgi:putative endonuclease